MNKELSEADVAFHELGELGFMDYFHFPPEQKLYTLKALRLAAEHAPKAEDLRTPDNKSFGFYTTMAKVYASEFPVESSGSPEQARRTAQQLFHQMIANKPREQIGRAVELIGRVEPRTPSPQPR